METLFDVAWKRRRLALERKSENLGIALYDDEHELEDEDMKTLSQLRSPERGILIVCAMGGGPGHKNGA